MIEAKVIGKTKEIYVQSSGSTQELSGELSAIFVEVFNGVKKRNRIEAIMMAMTVREIINQCDPLIAVGELAVKEE